MSMSRPYPPPPLSIPPPVPPSESRSKSSPSCSHHRLATLHPGLHFAARHRSIMGLVIISYENFLLAERNLGLHLLQSCLFHRILQQGIDPCSVPYSLGLPTHQLARKYVVEYSQKPTNVQCHDPRLLPINHDQLNHLFV